MSRFQILEPPTLPPLPLPPPNQAGLACGAYKITRPIVEQNLNENRLMLNHRNFHFIEPDVFENFSNLVVIDLSNNSINSLPANLFDHSFSLTKLHLDHNQIARISGDDFSKAAQLNELSLSNNMIVSIGESYIRSKSLKILNLSHNFIETVNGLAFASLPELTNLNLSHNKIYQINGSAFYANRNLEFLFLENNNLTELHNCTLRAQENLRILNLRNNQLQSLNSQLFANKTNMISLLVWENPIGDLANNFLILPQHLIHLDLTIECPITFHMFAPLAQLETFKVNLMAPEVFRFRENLDSGHFENKPNLTCFQLAVVRLHLEAELVVNLSRNLDEFYLKCKEPNGSNESKLNFYRQIDSWPNLRKFSLVNFTRTTICNWDQRTRWNRNRVFRLDELNLRGAIFLGKKKSIDHKCELLANLDLSFCQIDLDTTTGLWLTRNLRNINLQAIKIPELKRNFFKYTPLLQTINLEGCSISKIEKFTFALFGHRLEYLNLRRNHLKVITRYMMIGIDRNRTTLLFEFNPAFINRRIEDF